METLHRRPEGARGASSCPLSDDGGFSFIELLTVLVVMGILASMAAPRLDFGSYALNGAARSVGSTLLRSQRLAVQQQHPVVVAFDAAGGQLRVHEDRDGDLQIGGGEAVRYQALPEAVRIGRGGAPAILATDADVTFTLRQGGLPAVVFYRNGSASEEGGFYLTAGGAERVRTETRAAVIQRSTGRPHWFHFSGQAWEEE